MGTAEWTGWIGGIAGGSLGVLGGLIGTYCAVRNTNGPRERRFVIRAAQVSWGLLTLFLVGLFLIPSPYGFLLWIPYSFLLVVGIRAMNLGQQRIRDAELELSAERNGDSP
jgi:hypothetical protein